MAKTLPRFRRSAELEEDRRQVERVTGQASESTPAAGKAGGDRRQMRGIPIVGAATGASPGTDPYQALLAREQQRRRHGLGT